MHTRQIYTFLMHSSENIFSSVFCKTAFCFRPPPGTLSLDPSIHADSNFRLAKPQYFTLFSLYTSSNCHQSDFTQVLQEPWIIKHQSLSSSSLTLYICLTVQCTQRAENLFLKADNATSSSGLGLLSICTTVYSYFNVMHWKSATQQIMTKQFFSEQNMHYNT